MEDTNLVWEGGPENSKRIVPANRHLLGTRGGCGAAAAAFLAGGSICSPGMAPEAAYDAFGVFRPTLPQKISFSQSSSRNAAQQKTPSASHMAACGGGGPSVAAEEVAQGPRLGVGGVQAVVLPAQAGNHCFRLLRALRAHTKPYRKPIYCGKRYWRLHAPGGPGPWRSPSSAG